MRKLCYI